jgi:hypothetical protein
MSAFIPHKFFDTLTRNLQVMRSHIVVTHRRREGMCMVLHWKSKNLDWRTDRDYRQNDGQ